MSDLLDRIAGLSAEKRRLLLAKIAKPAISSGLPPLERLNESCTMPLSPSQERLWFLEQMAPSTAMYNVPLAFEIRGALQLETLVWSVEKLVSRHESLRTIFLSEAGIPRQQVGFGVPIVTVEDLESLGGEEFAAGLRSRILEESRRTFDLSRGPLLRVKIFRNSSSYHVILMTLHHLICDGWSLSILVRELGILYEAKLARRQNPLDKLDFQYGDYAAWQRVWLKAGRGEDLTYWREQLSGVLPLELACDHQRPPVQTENGGACRFVLPSQLGNDLRKLGRRLGVTLSTVLLTGYEMLLSRYSGQRNFAVGVPVAGRSLPELESLIGLFVNMVAVRCDVTPELTVRELVLATHRTLVNALSRQDVPFATLVDELHARRDASRPPLVQATFVLQNVPLPNLKFGGLELVPVDVDNQTAKFELGLEFLELDGLLRGRLEYNADLFDRETAASMTEHLQLLFVEMLANPEAPALRIPILTEGQRQLVLSEWNATNTKMSPATLHGLFEDVVQVSPTSLAIEAVDGSMTYEELNAEANRLAHRLIAEGVTRDDVIGLCVHRGRELVIGVLGILKAGAAYLPLEPTLPSHRVSFLLADSSARMLLASREAAVALGETNARMLFLDQRSEEVRVDNPDVGCIPEGLAYIIYTSGSTGLPKGVEIEHRNASALFAWARRFFSDLERKRVLCAASISFDASTLEVFTALTSGGTAVIVDDVFSAANVDATLMLIVPPTLRDVLDRGLPRGLRTIVFGGEVLTKDAVRLIKGRPGVSRIVNLYGPTEATVCSTYAVLDGDENPPPIGRPIDNAKAYILDEYMQPVPVGVTGELYLGGAGIARGYVNRPELNAKTFMPDPYNPGGRLYRSGDFGRHMRDGSLLFVGRRDSQVKLNGLRIELAEIEAVLVSSELVESAAVVVQNTGSGEKTLVAYVVLMANGAADIFALRRFLTDRLPSHAVPSRIVEVQTMPRLNSGKIDKSALSPTQEQGIEQRNKGMSDKVLRDVTHIALRILEVECIDPEDDLFQQGMSSLLSIRILTRVEREFGVAPTLREFFQNPTLGWLAARIREFRQPESPQTSLSGVS